MHRKVSLLRLVEVSTGGMEGLMFSLLPASLADSWLLRETIGAEIEVLRDTELVEQARVNRTMKTDGDRKRDASQWGGTRVQTGIRGNSHALWRGQYRSI